MMAKGYTLLILAVLPEMKAGLQVVLPTRSPGVEATFTNDSFLAERVRTYLDCYHRVSTDAEHSDTDGVFCPASFDGWSCWDVTAAGHTASTPCPGSDHLKFATKRCLPDGTWETSEVSGEEIVDYSSCQFEVSVRYNDDLLFRILKELSKLEYSPYMDPLTTQAFDNCLENILSQPIPANGGGLHCPRTFDGWSCWNDTSAGGVAYVPCPSFIPGFLSERFAHKVCTDDGTWFRHPDTNKTWSNYTTCVDNEDLSFRERINNLYIAGYSTSVVALLLSLGIFFFFKSLQCTRISIHKNLFISFIVNNVMWIIWYTEVVRKPEVLTSNKMPCQVLHVVVHYFLVSNYLWMFCEGLYLHTLLVMAFVAENKLMKWFYLLGWGIPFLLICIYAWVRKSYPKETTYCWIDESSYLWIISGPILFSMLLNFVFLVNIVRVLVTKLRAVNSPDAHQTRKAVRATLILIPLLGLHHFVTPFRPVPKSPGEAVYESVSAVVTSFQGLCVALLFCFFNGEVIRVIRNFVGKQLLLGHSSYPTFPATV